MLQTLMMFLAPAAAQPQATADTPPAAGAPAPVWPVRRSVSWKWAARVLAEAVGLLAMLAGCGLVLRLIEVLLPA
jgi:hypothetical protein